MGVGERLYIPENSVPVLHSRTLLTNLDKNLAHLGLLLSLQDLCFECVFKLGIF